MEIDLAGEKLLLSEHKIIYWSREKTVFIADLHLGKTTHFRKSGIAIPNAVMETEISQIEHIITRFRPLRIFFLGDLFHSNLNQEWNVFLDFLKLHSTIEFILIKGNHDILPDESYEVNLLKVVEEPFELQPFVLSHHPLEEESRNNQLLNLCGHVHPGVTIRGKGKSNLSLPCFYQHNQQLILPAFGRFTGIGKIQPQYGSKTYVVLHKSVQEIA